MGKDKKIIEERLFSYLHIAHVQLNFCQFLENGFQKCFTLGTFVT